MYAMYDSPLVTTEQHSYLGVQLQTIMATTYTVYIPAIRSVKYLVFSREICMQYCPTNLPQLAYKQFVLPILEYCAPIWDRKHRVARFVIVILYALLCGP